MATPTRKVSRGPGFTCVFCQKYFKPTTSQPIHIRRHIQEKPYNCRQCSFSATCVTDVYLHERKIHTGGEQYTCVFCDKRFTNPFTLKTHFRRWHQAVPVPEETIECGICNKKFGNKGHLTQHMKAHQRNGKQFECLKCGKWFVLERNLEKHQENVHGGGNRKLMNQVQGRQIMAKQGEGQDLQILKVYSMK